MKKFRIQNLELRINFKIPKQLIKTSKITLFLITIPFTFFVLSSCSEKATRQNSLINVTVTPAIEKTIPQTYTVVGQVVPKQQVQLKARITGYLEKMNFTEGGYVKQGQLLYEIQKDQYVAERDQAKGQLLQAQATYDNAKINYDRQKALFVKNAVSQKDYDNAAQTLYASDGALLIAKANLSLASLNLSYTDIYAPLDGRIGISSYYPGSLLNLASEPLADIVMINPIWVEFEVPEQILINVLQDKNNETLLPSKTNPNLITSGIISTLVLSNGTTYSEKGEIDFINNRTDPLTGTIQMRALYKNSQQFLLPGDYVNVILEKAKESPSLLIPQIAMQNDQVGTYVFIVNKNSVVEQKYIELGEVYGTCVVVKKGLQKGDLIVTDGILNIRDGDKVSYKTVQPNIMGGQ